MAQTATLQQALTVPIEVQWEPSWLTWVSATTACLRALGVAYDAIEVAGHSGYAFTLSIAPGLCPSGPTGFDWADLVPGAMSLGRSVLLFTSGDCHTRTTRCERTIAHCKAAYELVSREIEAGRPCVLWGAYLPEFAVVYGVHDGCYLVKSYRECKGEPQPPIRYDELDAPGGPAVFAFPTARAVDRQEADRQALRRAVARIAPPMGYHNWRHGLAAYDLWIEQLEKAQDISAFGVSLNAQVWAEARYMGNQFLHRLSQRHPHVGAQLLQAAEAYDEVAAAHCAAAKAFPFPGDKGMPDESTRLYAADILADARAAEVRAAAAMASALQADWPVPA